MLKTVSLIGLIVTSIISHAEISAHVNRTELTATGLLSSSPSRTLLSYVVSCALPKGKELYADFNEERFVFKGSIGLAPNWLDRPLTLREQRWVTACLLARTNYFGKSIKISIRTREPSIRALRVSESERREYPLHEGGFFGNLFTDKPVAYVCTGNVLGMSENTVLRDRICAQNSLIITPSGQTVSKCGFLITGQCGESSSQTINGQRYEEVVHVYLKPTLAQGYNNL